MLVLVHFPPRLVRTHPDQGSAGNILIKTMKISVGMVQDIVLDPPVRSIATQNVQDVA